MVLLAPFFFVSYLIEAPIVNHYVQGPPSDQVKKAVFRANIVSYLLLAAFNLVWLILSIRHGAVI